MLITCSYAGLPADTLGGHRTRFYDQYKALLEFYHQSANLQFFKNLIKVPHLPKVSATQKMLKLYQAFIMIYCSGFQDPPNFLVASNLHSHVKPVAIVPEPEPEPEPQEAATDLLIDTTSVASSDDTDLTSQNMNQSGRPSSPPRPDEK